MRENFLRYWNVRIKNFLVKNYFSRIILASLSSFLENIFKVFIFAIFQQFFILFVTNNFIFGKSEIIQTRFCLEDLDQEQDDAILIIPDVDNKW